MKRIKITFCKCGCGGIVKKEGATTLRGHHMRLRDKTELKERYIALLKKGMLRKYGVENAAHIKESLEKRTKTRFKNYNGRYDSCTKEERQKIGSDSGKIGGAKTAKRWKENPEEFKKFLELSHAKQRLPGQNYERLTGEGNPMKREDVRIKHQKAVKKAMSRPGVQEKKQKTILQRYGGYTYVLKGEEHYRWNGGKSFTRGEHWKFISKMILDRDSHQCAICQATGLLHVHHVVPIRSKIEVDLLNDFTNLVTLCPKHHMEAEWGHKHKDEIAEHVNSVTAKLMQQVHENEWLC